MEALILNGIAKAGNHALQKACALHGVDLQIHHIYYADKVAGEKYLFITRHPRNIICARLQDAMQQRVTPIGLQYGLADLGDTIRKMHVDFLGWLTDPDTTVIRYEELVGSDRVMRQIASALGVAYVEGSWEQLPGGTDTWSGHPSDWTKIWTDKAQAIWESVGGPEMEAAYGY
jgi:hypothetical protein